MEENQKNDAVEHILDQWRLARPDLDVFAMGVLGRMKRCALLLERQLDTVFAQFGLSQWMFDVLATLRRAGAPYSLTPTALFSSLMVTSGTLTHRLHVLEEKGWIVRADSAEDGRSTLVRLTDAGFALIDAAVTAHVANEQALLQGLSARSQQSLDNRLAELLASLEAGGQAR
ncbi:MAG: MarR family transcriptional regulator [Paludibacterium sp.]|uniref:MarR family winged helix-turn-helix transcriptional regulator n=1 Tax=Paludibacterium sp. TaxID=1917523 RepID=UPI0025FBE721|nr:MarR family transcriptional regulator [Paludibacterium sp.]MBV8046581.1 MarR family transcriptional regulator [Paludibacterium sp.]MBV8647044.1 MarR family transcriptional regulator [Paludibacterium sp.]